MTHYKFISIPRPSRPERSTYYERRKHLTNPMTDVILVAVLAVILGVAHFIQS